MKEEAQPNLLDVPPDWQRLWAGMPNYTQEDQMPWQSVKVHFRNAAEDRERFAALDVDYSGFRRNKLIPVPGINPEGENNFGMELTYIK